MRTLSLTWLRVDDHLLPRVCGWEGAVFGHVLAGSKLQHLHQAQGDAPLEQEPLVQLGAAAAAAADAVLTPASGSESYRLQQLVVADSAGAVTTLVFYVWANYSL